MTEYDSTTISDTQPRKNDVWIENVGLRLSIYSYIRYLYSWGNYIDFCHVEVISGKVNILEFVHHFLNTFIKGDKDLCLLLSQYHNHW